MGLKQDAVSRKEIYYLKPSDINVDPKWNERTKGERLDAHIKELAISIAEIGVLEPLTVRTDKATGKHWITDGFCRMAAVKRAMEAGAEIKSVPVKLHVGPANEADHTFSMLIRNEGLELTTYEQAKVVKRLLGLGWTADEIAKKWGKSRAHISNLELLMSAHPDILKLIAADKVSISLVLDELRNNPDKAVEVVAKAVGKASAKGKKKATKRTAKSGKRVAWAKHGPASVELLKRLFVAYDGLMEVPDEIGDVINEAREYMAEAGIIKEEG